jgi:Na+/proline symporter
MGRLFRTGAGWTMIAIAFAAFVAAVAIIIYEVEVYLPEHQGVDQRAPAIIHQTHPPLEVPN